MGLFEATILWVAGTILFALTFQQLRRANPNEKIPQVFGRPKHHPGEIYVYRAIAIVLLLLASLAWAEVLGLWSVLLIFLAGVPVGILNAQHNRQVEGRRENSASS